MAGQQLPPQEMLAEPVWAAWVSRRRDAHGRGKITVEPGLVTSQTNIYRLCEPAAAALRSIDNDYTDAELATILDFTRKTGRVLRKQLTILKETSAPL
jgi:hypothetical protein